MIRKIGGKGDLVKLTVPVEAAGVFRTLHANMRLDILIENVVDGQVTLVIEEPRLEDHRG